MQEAPACPSRMVRLERKEIGEVPDSVATVLGWSVLVCVKYDGDCAVSPERAKVGILERNCKMTEQIEHSLSAMETELYMMNIAARQGNYDVVEYHANRCITLAGEIRRECFLQTHNSGTVAGYKEYPREEVKGSCITFPKPNIPVLDGSCLKIEEN